MYVCRNKLTHVALEFETGLDTKSTNIGDLIAATTKGAELLVKILEEQINNGRKDDKVCHIITLN
jgi:hypothetical protein